MNHERMTVAQALVKFLDQQYAERDGEEVKFIQGVWGIFGHGNVAGLSQALHQYQEVPYYLARNEQAMTHTAIAFAKAKYRMQALACTASVGPGSTNMITGAATATINRIPLLLLPSDTFAKRNVGPVLQELEYPLGQDVTFNDALRRVSRYWDRINRPEQLAWSMLEAFRVLTSPEETGAVTICLPQDVQTEAFDFPTSLFEKRVWRIPRIRADKKLYSEAVEILKQAEKPFIISGGGTLYSEAAEELKTFVEQTGIPVGETQAGKGALPFSHPQNMGSVGATGSLAANRLAEDADVILLIGTRLGDFTTSSKSQFQNPDVRFIHINVCSMDAHKLSSLPLQADARVTLEDLNEDLKEYEVEESYRESAENLRRAWHEEIDRVTHIAPQEKMQQPNIIGIVNELAGENSTVVCAAGSLPGDLHKLWKCSEPGGYHLEYGYSCMGYEIAGGVGVKMARPERDVVVMVGDGSYQMMSSELITAIQEGIKITVVLLNNHGFGSIGSLSESVGSERFGTDYKFSAVEKGTSEEEKLLPIDFAMNARSYGVGVHEVFSYYELEDALKSALKSDRTEVIVAEVDKVQKVPDYHSWWDVPISEVSESETVNQLRKEYEKKSEKRRYYF